ncbi:hypothetical protein [Wohlfahrtiimonas populi]|uniref:hypothetical protein n=1 Tax=Wohlfahrtiimonas populi TaxID=1940240 RepID=UPI00098D3BD8|nr:hypothetical protein [Wohlfahrtiimonas populi]
MKILIGFILFLSVSFACDQPYENIGRYRIGCPLIDKGKYSSLIFNEDMTIYEDSGNETVQKIYVVELYGKVEGIGFEKLLDYDNAEHDVKRYLRGIHKKFGRKLNTSLYSKRMVWLDSIKSDTSYVSIFSHKLTDYINQIIASD